MQTCHVRTAVVDIWVCLQAFLALHIGNAPSISKYSPVLTKRDSLQGPTVFSVISRTVVPG